jgi:hypothetical protein
LSGAQPGQRGAQLGGVECVDPGVDLGDGALGLVGVGVFDDRGDRAPSASRMMRP